MMEKGREATLPLSAHFPDLIERAEDEVEYVTRLLATLEYAFDRARRLQAQQNEKNAERAPEQYKPDFKEGDWLMVWEKAANESRLHKEVRKLTGHPAGALPGKLRYPWQGPYKMVRWVGERKCIVIRNGKEAEFNVNRLFMHHSWDEKHFDTSGTVPGALPRPTARKRSNRLRSNPNDAPASWGNHHFPASGHDRSSLTLWGWAYTCNHQRQRSGVSMAWELLL